MAEAMEAPAKKEIQSKASRAGLTFAVSRVEKKIRQSRLAKRVGVESYIYLTGVVEAVVHDLLSKADAHAAGLDPPAKRMTNQHVLAAARSDPARAPRSRNTSKRTCASRGAARSGGKATKSSGWSRSGTSCPARGMPA